MGDPNRRRLAIGLLLPLLLSACQNKTALEQVQERGELRILTRNAATTYYEGADGPRGMEYELAKEFADSLGVKLVLLPAANVSEVLQRLQQGEADLAAAGLTVTEERKKHLRFTPPYQSITQQLVYRLGNKRPEGITDLAGDLEVLSNSSHAERLRELKKLHPKLTWSENAQADSEELLTLVWDGVVDYTVADSNEVALNQRFYPELRVAFDLTEPEPLAWAFRREADNSLYQAATAWFEQAQSAGLLSQLVERHYGHVEEFDYVGARVFRLHAKQRLPNYLGVFQKAAQDNRLDWRLLAAMAYQESHWNPNAVSPTGVRGIMMLTKNTASYLGVSKRTDAGQSIKGGARYLRDLINRVPERIPFPDRLWLAVAAYNVGLGHVEDARILTETRGGNPDLWMDVKEALPLLRKRSWYKRTRYGYARGNEALRYVENIRTYYDILVWTTAQERAEPEPLPKGLTIAGQAL